MIACAQLEIVNLPFPVIPLEPLTLRRLFRLLLLLERGTLPKSLLVQNHLKNDVTVRYSRLPITLLPTLAGVHNTSPSNQGYAVQVGVQHLSKSGLDNGPWLIKGSVCHNLRPKDYLAEGLDHFLPDESFWVLVNGLPKSRHN